MGPETRRPAPSRCELFHTPKISAASCDSPGRLALPIRAYCSAVGCRFNGRGRGRVIPRLPRMEPHSGKSRLSQPISARAPPDPSSLAVAQESHAPSVSACVLYLLGAALACWRSLSSHRLAQDDVVIEDPIADAAAPRVSSLRLLQPTSKTGGPVLLSPTQDGSQPPPSPCPRSS